MSAKGISSGPVGRLCQISAGMLVLRKANLDQSRIDIE
jgi:hypothetical protein